VCLWGGDQVSPTGACHGDGRVAQAPRPVGRSSSWYANHYVVKDKALLGCRPQTVYLPVPAAIGLDGAKAEAREMRRRYHGVSIGKPTP
jgi:hypothetical protein